MPVRVPRGEMFSIQWSYKATSVSMKYFIITGDDDDDDDSFEDHNDGWIIVNSLLIMALNEQWKWLKQDPR